MDKMARRRILIAAVCFLSGLLLFLVTFQSFESLTGKVLFACFTYLVSLVFATAAMNPSGRLVDLVIWPRAKKRLLPPLRGSFVRHLLWFAAGWFLMGLETTVEVLNLKRVFPGLSH